jgi:hypothetical protein
MGTAAAAQRAYHPNLPPRGRSAPRARLPPTTDGRAQDPAVDASRSTPAPTRTEPPTDRAIAAARDRAAREVRRRHRGAQGIGITPVSAATAWEWDEPDDYELNNWWGDGKLAGTTSMLVRSSDGFCWAALANGNGINLEEMVWEMIQNVRSWPPGDQL